MASRLNFTETGNLRYCVYRLFDDIRLLQMFKVSKETVYSIYGIIEKARKRLEIIPEKLDNGSGDGMLNEVFVWRFLLGDSDKYPRSICKRDDINELFLLSEIQRKYET